MKNIPLKFYNIRGEKHNKNKDIPESPGVYFIWSLNELLYIGASANLRRRIAEHLGKGIFKVEMINDGEAEKVCFIVTEDENEAFKIEAELISLIPTKWNKIPYYKLNI